MARTYKLKVGSDEIDLIAASPGIVGIYGQLGGYKIPEGVLGGGRIPETYELLIRDTDVDNVAAKTVALVKLVLNCKYYHEELWQPEPGYIIQEVEGETNPRYALVYTALEIEVPDLFRYWLEKSHMLNTFGLTLVREHPWRSAAPGTIGTAITLGETDGPATPTRVHVANFRDDVLITHFKENDGGAYTDLTPGDTLFPAVVAQNDELLWGSTDQPLKHIVIPKLGTKGALTDTTLKLYSGIAGPGWTELVHGTDYTCYPGSTLEDCLEQNDEDIVLNIKPIATAAKGIRDGVNADWIMMRETHAAPVYATNPIQHATEAVYAQKTPEVEIPAAAIKGDSGPLFLFRMRTPAGGDENPGFSSLSRILMGVRSSGLDKFTSHLNAGGEDNPAEWTVSYGDDSSAVADPMAPGGKHCAVSFATETGMVKRVQFLGDDILDKWGPAEYLSLVRCQQIGGDPGDVEVMLRTFTGSTDNYAPHVNSDEIPLAGVDQGPEAVNFGLLSIPFGRKFAADSLASTDVIFQVLAKLNTGTATLVIYDPILLPVDEGSVGIDDFISDPDLGSSALRGLCALDLDAGVIDWRAQKYSVVGANLIPADMWTIQNRPPPFKKLAAKTRLYILMLHYPSGGSWGVGPLIASFGCHVSFEMFGHDRFSVLRGAG